MKLNSSLRLVITFTMLQLAVFSGRASAQVITTYAGEGDQGFAGDGGQASLAQFYGPGDVAIGPHGDLYIADCRNNRIRKVNPAGIITTFAGKDTAGYSGDGGPATAAKLYFPTGVAVDKVGNVYVPDCSNNVVRKIDTLGIITTIAGTGIWWGITGDGGPATAAFLSRPYGVAVDAVGNIYVADCNNNRIRKIDTAGIIHTIAGNGTSGYTGDWGQATAMELSYPRAVAVDTAGNIFIADVGNNKVEKVTPSGIMTTIAGISIAGFSGDGGPASNAALNTPVGIKTDTKGNIYIADYYNDCIRMIDTNGIINRVAGNTIAGFGGDGGAALDAMLNHPGGMAIDTGGNIYIADYWNNRIRKVFAVPESTTPPILVSSPKVNIYPNPTNGSFQITVTGLPKEPISVSIIDITGRVIINKDIETNKPTNFTINAGTGPYYIRLLIEGVPHTYKLVVE